jgi:hypothetical protein
MNRLELQGALEGPCACLLRVHCKHVLPQHAACAPPSVISSSLHTVLSPCTYPQQRPIPTVGGHPPFRYACCSPPCASLASRQRHPQQPISPLQRWCPFFSAQHKHCIFLHLPMQVSVAVLLDNFVTASTKMENELRDRKLQERKALTQFQNPLQPLILRLADRSERDWAG